MNTWLFDITKTRAQNANWLFEIIEFIRQTRMWLFQITKADILVM